ncbi:23S rRNA (adenine(2030)-N(6))-methyltransferase RlmJ [Rhizobium beringeri]
MLFRPQDRLSAMELHPEDYVRLHRLFEGDHHAHHRALTAGWRSRASAAEEKRGIVLVDPPFEEEDEYQRLAEGAGKRPIGAFPAAPIACGIR